MINCPKIGSSTALAIADKEGSIIENAKSAQDANAELVVKDARKLLQPEYFADKSVMINEALEAVPPLILSQ